MPSAISDDDRKTVKRAVPRSTNKIHAVAIAKLYVAYPHRHKWTYTGLQGAVVLANDLVGNTFWIKMVDVSPANRAVIWDQEIYDSFSYNLDRTFFHTFEIEDCLAGLSFVDEKEAKKFKEKMDDREKNAHKNTKSNPFGNSTGSNQRLVSGANWKQNIIGSIFGHWGSSSSNQPPNPASMPVTSPSTSSLSSPPARSRSSTAERTDPELQTILKELKEKGIGDDQIKQNADFIRKYIEESKGKGSLMEVNGKKAKIPPPPPPSAPTVGSKSVSPQSTGGGSKRGPAPALPPARRANPTHNVAKHGSVNHASVDSLPQPTITAPSITEAGKLAQKNVPELPSKPMSTSCAPPPPPPPPPFPIGDSAVKRPAATEMPKPAVGRVDLLADIRGGARLKKVSDAEKNDRSTAMIGKRSPSQISPPVVGGSNPPDGGLAGALASALAARKSKVGHSDDEDEKDDW